MSLAFVASSREERRKKQRFSTNRYCSQVRDPGPVRTVHPVIILTGFGHYRLFGRRRLHRWSFLPKSFFVRRFISEGVVHSRCLLALGGVESTNRGFCVKFESRCLIQTWRKTAAEWLQSLRMKEDRMKQIHDYFNFLSWTRNSGRLHDESDRECASSFSDVSFSIYFRACQINTENSGVMRKWRVSFVETINVSSNTHSVHNPGPLQPKQLQIEYRAKW